MADRCVVALRLRFQSLIGIRIHLKWRPVLDTVEVEIHLFGGLAFAYNRKQEDVTDEWVVEPQRSRRIVRPVLNTFWLIRDVLRYGADCEVVSPEDVRDHLRQEAIALANLYH